MAATARDQAISLLKDGQPADSIDFFLQAIVEDPADVESYLYLGFVYARQDQLEKAVDVLEQAVDVAPTNPKVHYNLGVAYQKAHNITQAKDEYLRALGLDPSYAIAKKALDSLMSDHDSTQG